MRGPFTGAGAVIGALLLALSIAVLTVVFDRGRFWWQWWQRRATRGRQWRQRCLRGDATTIEAIEDWDQEMAFGEPLLQAAGVLAPLLGLIGTVLALMQVLASLGPGLTLPAAAPLAGYGRVLIATAVGLLVSLVATAALHANEATRRWQIADLRRQARRATAVPLPAAAPQP